MKGRIFAENYVLKIFLKDIKFYSLEHHNFSLDFSFPQIYKRKMCAERKKLMFIEFWSIFRSLDVTLRNASSERFSDSLA